MPDSAHEANLLVKFVMSDGVGSLWAQESLFVSIINSTHCMTRMKANKGRDHRFW